MLESITVAQIVEFAGVMTVLGTFLLTIRKVRKDQKDEILKEAFDADEKDRLTLETKLETIRKDLLAFAQQFEQEIDHIKEKQAGEIRNLGEKIEDLRSELRVQHGQLISLVTKLIDKS